ncbi:MAG: hypothetical protein ACREK8_10730, partial [Gemmatimonadales bacterium]
SYLLSTDWGGLRNLSNPMLTVLMFAGALGAGIAGHWLITPIMHPHATTLQYVNEWAVIVAGVGLWFRAGRAIQAKAAAG